MSRRFGLMLKSYGPDLALAQRLVASYRRFNTEGLPLYVLVPEQDRESFEVLAGGGVVVLDETPLMHHFATGPVDGMREGYINQQIVKLSFWELDYLDDYLVMDSDAVFLRPFGRADFMADADTPFTVLTEDNDLRADPVYFREHWQGREEHLRRIQELVGLDDPRLLTCHNHQVFDSRVLESLRDHFLHPREWGYVDLLAAAPYEFSWYNFWLQVSHVVPLEVREPWFKMIHSQGQHAELAIRGLTDADLARGYIGLVLNSNFSRTWGDLQADEPPSVTLARYVGIRTLASALLRRVALLPKTLRRRDPQ